LIGSTDHSDEGILQSLNGKLAELQQQFFRIWKKLKAKVAAVSGSRSPEDTQNAVNIENGYTQAQDY